MFLRQPVPFPKSTTIKARLFVTFCLWFVFFTSAGFDSQFTSNLLAYYAEEKIKSLEELTSKTHIKLFADRFSKRLITVAKYNLSEQFLARMEEVEGMEGPWVNDFNGIEYAYVFGMATNDFFFKSAFNIDDFSFKRFYLMDHVISTTPLVYLSP